MVRRSCVLHLAVEPFTTHDEARYWLRIVIFTYPHLHSTTPLGGGRSQSEYCHDNFGTGNLQWCDHRMVKSLKICLIHFNIIHERDRQTDRQTLHDGIGRAYAYHRAAKKCKPIVHTHRQR